MSEKRFLYRNFLGEEVEKRFTEEYDEEWGIYLSDNLTGDWYNINPYKIVDTCNNLWEQIVKLREENEQLRKKTCKTCCMYSFCKSCGQVALHMIRTSDGERFIGSCEKHSTNILEWAKKSRETKEKNKIMW